MAALFALGGCGGATENAPQPAQTAAAKDKKHQLKSVKADCMKQFAMHVYPKEMGSPAVKPDNPEINPNWNIQNSLSKAQMTAYRKATDGCMIEAAKKVLGITPEEARPYLNKEIKAALDDLECGKDFYPAFMPKDEAVGQQINEESGM
jgi:hypothetical protein